MKIRFKRVDDDYPRIDDWIRPIVDICIKNEVFVRIVCDILYTYGEYTESLYAIVETALKKSAYLIMSENDNVKCLYKELSKLLLDFYFNVISDDFAKELFAYDQDRYLKHKYKYPNQRIARYRGLLFEELVAALVKKKFESDIYERGCKIYINNECIIARYGKGNTSHRETFDIIGWIEDRNYGEFYECKINPERFDESNYRLFMVLSDKLNDNKINNYAICFVSADSDETLKARKEYIEYINPDCHCDFYLVGRDSIMTVSNMLISEVA